MKLNRKLALRVDDPRCQLAIEQIRKRHSQSAVFLTFGERERSAGHSDLGVWKGGVGDADHLSSTSPDAAICAHTSGVAVVTDDGGAMDEHVIVSTQELECLHFELDVRAVGSAHDEQSGVDRTAESKRIKLSRSLPAALLFRV